MNLTILALSLLLSAPGIEVARSQAHNSPSGTPSALMGPPRCEKAALSVSLVT